MRSVRSLLFFTIVSAWIFIPGATLAQQNPSPTCTLTATPSVVEKGGTSNLKWTSRNAIGGTITSVGSVGPSGIQGVIPTKTTEYVGIFTGAGGSTRCSVVVSVVLPDNSGTTGGVSPANHQIESGTPEDDFFDSNKPGGSALPTSPSTFAPTSQPTQAGSQGPLVSCDGLNCRACDLAQLAQKLINFLILLSIPIAALLIAYAGFLYFTSGVSESLDNLGTAKRVLWDGLIGFLIAISAWLIIQTLLFALLKDEYYKGWNTIQCVDQKDRPRDKNIGTLINEILPTLNVAPSSVSVSNNVNSFTGGTASCPTGYTYSAPNEDDSTGTCFNLETGEYKDPAFSIPSSASASCSALGSAFCCLAGKESSYNPLICGDNGFSCGLLQINMTANNVVCDGQVLDCPSAFTGRYTCKNGICTNVSIKPGYEALAADCKAKLQNPSCNKQTADTLLNTPRGYANWSTAASCGLI